MKTVDKALSVLGQFTLERPEIGLSDLARMADLDKATTRRLLVSMAKHGFVEQSEATRAYRLGHGFLRLARIREATVPLTRIAQEACDWLSAAAEETVHASLPGPFGMTTVAHRLPNRAHVINISPAQVLPYHATASGLAFWAFATAETRERLFGLKRDKLTDATETTKADLLKTLNAYRDQGYSLTQSTFERDVESLAMPFSQDDGDPTGCIAVALPRGALTTERREALLSLLRDAVERVERALTGL